MQSQPVSITCPLCKKTSHNAEDVRHGYCDNCKLFHDGLGGVCAVHEAMGWGRMLTGERSVCSMCLEKPEEHLLAMAKRVLFLQRRSGL